MISTQYVKLNMVPSGVLPVLYCSQYDIGRPLGMTVYNGGEAVDLDGYTCTIEATRTDGTAITAAVTTDDNIGAFVTTATMTNQADKYMAKLVLFDSNSCRVGSLAFVMVVTAKTMDENAESIEEDASLYQQYTGTVQALIADIREDIADLNSQTHDTVADMKADTNLKAGVYVRTGGYYAVNDDGGALYRIYSTAPDSYYETLSNGLYAKLVETIITPEMFGAKGDGVTDDSGAFEAALNSNKQVFLNAKTYFVHYTLNNPAKINIVGSGSRLTSIKLGNNLFANAITDSKIEGVYFFCDNSDTNTFWVFPKRLSNVTITECEFRYFDKIFYELASCSDIRGNSFAFIKHTFCHYAVDTFFVNNYINAPKYKNPQTIGFEHTVAHCSIVGNFFDYWYKVFAVTQSFNNVSVTGNIFDVCYCIFYNNISGVTFTGNTISNMTKQADWDVSGNPDMNEKLWSVAIREFGGNVSTQWINSVFAHNSVGNDTDMYINCMSKSRYPTYNFLVDEYVSPSKIDFGAYKSGIADDLQRVMIRPMLKRQVSVLPSAALTGTVETFNNDEVIYNGNLYINIDGAWKQLTNA